MMNSARQYCENCGAALPPHSRFCEQCGSHAPGPQPGAERQPLEWDAKLSIFQDDLVVKQLALVLAVPLVFLFLFSLVLDWPPSMESVLQAGKIVLIVAAILGVLLLAAALFYSGGYEFHYRLDEEGIQARPTGRTAVKNTIANLLLMFSGRPGLMGIGLLAQTRQVEYIAWKDVKKLSAQSSRRTITLYKGRRPWMLVVCNPAVYENVLQLIQDRTGFHIPTPV